MTVESGLRALRRVGIVWAWLLLAAGLAQAAVASDARLAEDKPGYTLEQAQSCLAEVRPLVQRIAGRKIVELPAVKLVTREEYVHAMTDKPPDGSKPKALPAYANYAFGAYHPARRAIHLLAGNFRPRLKRAGVPSRYHDILLKMIVAHELTHVLQNQEVGLGKRKSALVRTIIEGHAKFVMDEVAKALGVSKAVAEFEKTIGVGLTPAQRVEERRVYVDGSKFIAWHNRKGGPERVWRIIKSPPEDESEILYPETYGSNVR